MKIFRTILILALLAVPAFAFAADVTGDFKVVSTENISISEVKVTLEAYHKQGSFSAGKTYEDRWAVPAELLAKNFVPVRREWIALEGKGEMAWEVMERQGYASTLYLDKGIIASGDMKYRCAIILKNDGTQASPGAAPELVGPTSGVVKYQPGDGIMMKWSGKGPNYRFEIYDESAGKAVYSYGGRKADKLVNTRVFGRNRSYLWSVRQADDGLNFGPATQKKFTQRTIAEFVSKVCSACNGAGGHYVPDPPPQPHVVKAWQVCYRCNGTGREQVWEDQYYLDFNK